MVPRRHSIPTPSLDSFYTAPADLATYSPGTAIRSRPVDVAFLGLIPQRVAATQVLYRSTTMHGDPTVAATTVLRSRNTEVGVHRSSRLLSYQCAIDAIDGSHFPSYRLRRHSGFAVSVPALEYLLVMAALRRGWMVSIPDHEGLQGNWGFAREPGFHILDAIRACHNTPEIAADLAEDAAVGLWGYSGGGLASAWAAEMASEYAPELDIVGAVLGSPVGDPGETFRRLNATPFAGLPVLVIAALAREYPQVRSLIAEHGSAAGIAALERAATMSTTQALIAFAGDDIANYTDLTMAQLLADPGLQEVFDDIRLGSHAPSMPILAVQAIHDPVISVVDIDAQMRRYRELGADVTYRRDRLSEHILLHTISAPMSLTWLADRFDGVPSTPGTTQTVWSVALCRGWIAGMLQLALAVLYVVLGLAPRPRGRQ